VEARAERQPVGRPRMQPISDRYAHIAEEKLPENLHTGDKCDPIQHIYLSPDRFSKIDQHHSIADKMGDIFVPYDLPRPKRANNRRFDGWRLCYTLLDTTPWRCSTIVRT